MQPSDNPVSVNVMDALVKDKRAYHELLVRSGFVLPDLESKFVSCDNLIAVHNKKIYGLRVEEVFYRQCVTPPSKQVLVDKLNYYLKVQGLPPSGINPIRKNYPDKSWLILAIASLSKGQDEIFKKDYVPQPSEKRANAKMNFMVSNSDGLFTNVPTHLLSTKPNRGFKIGTVSKEDKLRAQMLIAQDRLAKQQALVEKRQMELEAHRSGKQQKDKVMAELEQEVRQKVINEYKEQADQYVHEQITLKQQELQQAFDQEVQNQVQRLSMAQSKLDQSLEFELDGEGMVVDEKMQNGIAGNLERSQIRRRNAKAAKTNVIGNQSEMGDSDVRSQFSAMELLRK
jgi:hypothetical protein